MTQTIKQFVDRNNVRMSCAWTDTNPNIDPKDWARGTSHYRCVLKIGPRRMTTYFSMGSAYTKEPSAEDLIDCLASDAASIENARSFEDWCADYGYDADSRKAEKIYKTCARQAARLRNLVGDSAMFRRLLFDTERL